MKATTTFLIAVALCLLTAGVTAYASGGAEPEQQAIAEQAVGWAAVAEAAAACDDFDWANLRSYLCYAGPVIMGLELLLLHWLAAVLSGWVFQWYGTHFLKHLLLDLEWIDPTPGKRRDARIRLLSLALHAVGFLPMYLVNIPEVSVAQVVRGFMLMIAAFFAGMWIYGKHHERLKIKDPDRAARQSANHTATQVFKRRADGAIGIKEGDDPTRWIRPEDIGIAAPGDTEAGDDTEPNQ